MKKRRYEMKKRENHKKRREIVSKKTVKGKTKKRTSKEDKLSLCGMVDLLYRRRTGTKWFTSWIQNQKVSRSSLSQSSLSNFTPTFLKHDYGQVLKFTFQYRNFVFCLTFIGYINKTLLRIFI